MKFGILLTQRFFPILLFIIACLVFLLYRPALNGPFIFDDIPNITTNADLRFSELTLPNLHSATQAIKAGPLGRPIAYLSFAMNYYFFGKAPYSFKLTNVLIHILNGFSVYWLVILLLRGYRFAYHSKLKKPHIQWVALLTASLWLVHPLNLTSVLYIVQRMNSLAAGFSLLTLCFYFKGRLQMLAGKKNVFNFALASIMLILALLCKENAALVPYLIVAGEFCLLRFSTKSGSNRLAVCIIALFVIAPFFLALFNIDRIEHYLVRSYELRPFTLIEHGLTETRALWFYIKLIIAPNIRELGLYHDDFGLSKNLLNPSSTLISLIGLFVLFSIALYFRSKTPILSFGILFFFIGHSMESSILSLEPVHEHRNYLPMFGLLFTGSYYSLHPDLTKNTRTPALCGLVFLLLWYSLTTFQRAVNWSSFGSLSLALAENHPNSARSTYGAGRLFTQLIKAEQESNNSPSNRYYTLAKTYFIRSYHSDKANPSGLFGILYLNAITEKPIDTEIFKQLHDQLSNHPIMPSTANSFTKLHKCWLEEICTLSGNQLRDLYLAALSTDSGSPRNRSSLTNELAILEIREGHADKAILLFKESIKIAPKRAQIWFNLIHTLIDQGMLEEAMVYLTQATSHFTDEKSRRQMNNLQILHDLWRKARADQLN